MQVFSDTTVCGKDDGGKFSVLFTSDCMKSFWITGVGVKCNRFSVRITWYTQNSLHPEKRGI